MMWKGAAAALLAIFASDSDRAGAASLDYDKMIVLDAEELAEGGVGQRYAEIRTVLMRSGISLEPISEALDPARGTYAVTFGADRYPIYDGSGNGDEAWGLATFALFDIVNRQLSKTQYRFYAISAGNELGGMLLTPEQALASRGALPERRDWPYLPTRDGPWFGQFQ